MVAFFFMCVIISTVDLVRKYKEIRMKLKGVVSDYHSFHEANKDWLSKFDNTDYNRNYKDASPPAYWKGLQTDWYDGDVALVPWNGKDSEPYMFLRSGRVDYHFNDVPNCVDYSSYFLDWKNPTKEENDYFEMIHGFRIPWGGGLVYKDYGDEYEINKVSSVVEDKP